MSAGTAGGGGANRGGGAGPGPLAERLHRLLLRAYPRRFRERYGAEIARTFRDAWVAEVGGGGRRARAAFWWRLARDEVRAGLRQRVAELGRSRARPGPAGPRGRSARPLGSVARDVRLALRSYGRTPGFAAVVVLTLALGIGANTAVFSVVDAVLLEPLPYEGSGRLVRLYMAEEEEPGGSAYVTGPFFLGYRESVEAFEELATVYTYAATGADLVTGGDAERVRTLLVSADYFDVLGQPPMLGRAFTREEERPDAGVVVVSHRLWRERLGSAPRAAGEVLVLDGRPHTVVGVMPAGFEDPLAGRVDVWAPQNLTDDGSNHPGNHYLSSIGRLRPGVDLAAAQAQVDVVTARLGETYPEMDEWGARLVPLHDDIVTNARTLLYVLLGGVGLVLLTACVNVANLFLVRSIGRRRELAVRAALGGRRGRLARQLLTESLLLAAVGGALGVVVAWAGVAALRTLGAGAIPRLEGTGFDPGVLAFTILVTGLTGLAFGVAPAWRAGRGDVAGALRERSSTGGPRVGRVRGGLVVAQVALALVLLTGAGLLAASFQRLRAVDLGFDPRSVLTYQVHLPDARYDADGRARFHDEIARRTAAMSGVRAAGSVSRLPATGRYHSWGTRPITGPLAGEGFIGADQRVIEGDYFRALGIDLVAGRLFGPEDGPDAPMRYVINRTAAERMFPGIDAVGQTMQVGGVDAWRGEVVGVVEDAAITVEGEHRPKVYHAHRQFADNRNWSIVQVVATEGPPEAALPAIRRELADIDPLLVLHEPRPLTDVVGQGVAQRRLALALFLSFAATALALAALGIYGVLAYAVTQRRQEISIRLALGAPAGRVRRQVLGRGLALATLGVGAGVAGAVGLTRFLAALLFEVDPLDPAVLAAVAGVLLATALAAGYLPARRATAVQPREALAEE